MKSPTKIHSNSGVYVTVNFLFQLFFVLNSLEYIFLPYPTTKEKQKLTEIKNKLQHKIEKKSAVKNKGP